MFTRKLIIACTITICIGSIIGAVLPAFVYNQFYAFGGFMYSLFFSFLASIIFLGLILYFITKSKFLITVTICLVLFLCIITVTSKVVLIIAKNNAIHLANTIIREIYQYRKSYGYYPENVDSLKIDSLIINDFKKAQTYTLNKKNSTFTINAWYDGWYNYTYYSKDRSWQKLD